MSRALLAVLAAVVLMAALPAPAAAQGVGPYQYFSLTPCRLADTRNPSGPSGGPILTHNTTRNFPVQTLCGVPVGAKAVSVNVTAVGPSGAGFLTLFPAGITRPVVSSLNYNTGEPAVGNGALVPLGTSDGSGTCPAGCDLSIFAWAGGVGTVHMVLDVTGYFQ